MKYYSFEEIDELGETIVKKYIKDKKLKNVWCIDVEGIVTDLLGCQVVYAQFAEDDPSKIGFLSNGITPIKVYKDNMIKPVVFPVNTIVIDLPMRLNRNYAQERFTIMHEGGHKIMESHSPGLLRACYESKFDTEYEYNKEDIKRLFNSCEVYANRFAAAVLMPRFLLDKVLKTYNNGEYISIYGSHLIKESDKIVIQKIANRLGVSYSALLNRFKSLNMFNVKEADEFLGQLTIFEEKQYGRDSL